MCIRDRSTAALLAIGASMTSFAAQGWAEEDGTWVYYDRNGDRVTDKLSLIHILMVEGNTLG